MIPKRSSPTLTWMRVTAVAFGLGVAVASGQGVAVADSDGDAGTSAASNDGQGGDTSGSAADSGSATDSDSGPGSGSTRGSDTGGTSNDADTGDTADSVAATEAEAEATAAEAEAEAAADADADADTDSGADPDPDSGPDTTTEATEATEDAAAPTGSTAEATAEAPTQEPQAPESADASSDAAPSAGPDAVTARARTAAAADQVAADEVAADQVAGAVGASTEPSTDTGGETGSDVSDIEITGTEDAAATPATASPAASLVTAHVTAERVDTAPPAKARPVTAATIVADVLTWIGLGPLASDLPVPAVPMPRLVEMLWLAVRQTQYTWNNQRPTAQPTLLSQDGDGVVRGELNATDYDDALLTYTVAAQGKFGTVLVDADGGFTYALNPGVTPTAATDTFAIAIDDLPGNARHVHGLGGLLGLGGPTTATITVDLSAAASFTPAAADDTATGSAGAVTVQMDADGRISVIDGTFTDARVYDTGDAAGLLNTLAGLLGAENGFAGADSITIQSVAAPAGDAEEFYRLRENVDGIPVIGSEVILVTDGAGTVTGLFNYHDTRLGTVDTTPDAGIGDGASAAALAAAALVDALGGPQTEAAALVDPATADTQLVIFAVDPDTAPQLAWRVTLRSTAAAEEAGNSIGATYYLYANGEQAGRIIRSTSNIQALSAPTTSVGTDLLGDSRELNVTRVTQWFFSSYRMADEQRSVETYTTAYGLFGWGGPVIPGDLVKRSWFGWSASAVSAHANMAAVYDYVDTVLGRDSFDGNGATIISSVRYNPRDTLDDYLIGYNNAFWDADAQQFAFGNAGELEAALDVVAHEFFHGVTSHVVGSGGSVLDYGESGALSEAYSDIMGNLVEGKTGSGAWLIGEDSARGALRSMADPSAVGANYRTYYSNRYTGTLDDAGEHWNSTIFSHAAYLMMTDSDTAAVSSQTWARVFYQSLFRLGADAVFTDGRAAVLDSAADLGFTPAQLQAIRDAFDTVGIAGSASTAGPEALLVGMS